MHPVHVCSYRVRCEFFLLQKPSWYIPAIIWLRVSYNYVERSGGFKNRTESVLPYWSDKYLTLLFLLQHLSSFIFCIFDKNISPTYIFWVGLRAYVRYNLIFSNHRHLLPVPYAENSTVKRRYYSVICCYRLPPAYNEYIFTAMNRKLKRKFPVTAIFSLHVLQKYHLAKRRIFIRRILLQNNLGPIRKWK
jgi:hypothetical protein